MANNAPSSRPSKRDSSSDDDSSSPDASTSRNNDPKANADSDAKANSAREEVKIYKTISRVHRACNACRKQKARCDGPENPPCRRCKQVGIECIFEKPPKENASSSAAAPDAGASADRIRILETQMSGMQNMISELVASIKANASAMTASPSQTLPPPQPSPRESSVSSNSPHSSRASRPDAYHSHSHRQQSTPLQQQHPSYAPPPHHRNSQHAISPSADSMHRYPPDAGAPGSHPQRPPYPPASRSFGSSNSSIVGVSSNSMPSAPIQASSGYPLQQPPSFQTAYGHPPSRTDAILLQQQPEPEPFDGASHHHNVWNAATNASSSSSQPVNAHARRRSGSRVGFTQEDRGRPSQPWTGSPSSSAADAPAGLAQPAGSSAWMPSSAPTSHPPRHSSRHRWTSSDRAASHIHSLDQNLTPSDGQTAGEDGEARETDISNDQLSAPIEALRGLADAAAAAAESEGHTSNDSSDEKQVDAEIAVGRSKQPDSAATPTLQLVDEGGKRSALAKQDDDLPDAMGKSPRKKRRRNTHADSPGSTAGTGSGVDAKAGAGGAGSSAGAAVGAGSNPASALSPSSASRSGRMEAPGLVSSSPGDLVTLGLVNETDAMRLFETFQKGVPKFISIFNLEDEPMTTDEAYHHVRTTSYFLFNVMLAIGAKVECGGKSPSRLYQTCMAQAKRNAKDTMFSPVAGKAAVQAMVLLAAYSENGWLSLGLSIRMAQELGLDRSFQKLMSALPSSGYIRHPPPPPPPKHLTFYHNSPSSHYTGSPTDVNSVGGESVDGKIGASANAAGANAVAANAAASGNADAAAKRELDELKDLARGSRLWFFLFLFDHQASYGAGRPAMLSKHYVRNCRAFLNLTYPLTVKTDARFISTLELLIIRETHYDAMAPYDQPVDARMLSKMRKVTEELNEWHQYWSADFEARGYQHDSFFQQSLVLQCASAELYLSCTALRGIRDANDADQMGPEQKELIIQATRAADTCLSISVNAREYHEMLGWAPHYTHVTAAFACVFLIKIARLFPRQVDTYGIFSNAERLASRLAEVPAGKYARVIRILLAQAWKKIADLSPAIGLYAALGAEATRPGAITPAEIKSGGPSDSGISLLYKLLQEYQSGQIDADLEASADGGAAHAAANAGATSAGEPSGSGARTPGFSELLNSGKWLTAGITSPSVGAGGVFGGLGAAAGSGSMSPTKAGLAGMYSHRGSISGIDSSLPVPANGDGIAWSSFLASHTPYEAHAHASAHHPIQLPLWMQESTGASSAGEAGAAVFGEAGKAEAKTSPAQARSWGHQDHYQSPIPHAGYTPAYQTPLAHGRHDSMGVGVPHQRGGSLVPPSPSSALQQQQQQQPQQGSAAAGAAGAAGAAQAAGATMFAASTNFDSVLSDLGLPLDGLDGLFVDLPINAATGQSNYSV